MFPLQGWYVEAPERCMMGLFPRLKKEEMKIGSRLRGLYLRRLRLTLASRGWHFFDAMAGSVPRWVNGGTVETVGGGICGPGTTRLSLGSSAG